MGSAYLDDFPNEISQTTNAPRPPIVHDPAEKMFSSFMNRIFSSQSKPAEPSSDSAVPEDRGGDEGEEEQDERTLRPEDAEGMARKSRDARGKGRDTEQRGAGHNDDFRGSENWDGDDDDIEVELQLRRERGSPLFDNPPREALVEETPKQKVKKSKKVKKSEDIAGTSGDADAGASVVGKKVKSKRKKKAAEEQIGIVIASPEDLPNGEDVNQRGPEEPKPKRKNKSKQSLQEMPEPIVSDAKDLPKNHIGTEELARDLKLGGKQSHAVDGTSLNKKKKKTAQPVAAVPIEDNGASINPLHLHTSYPGRPVIAPPQRVAMSVEPLIPITPSEDAHEDQLSRANISWNALAKLNNFTSPKSSRVEDEIPSDMQSSSKKKRKHKSLLSEELALPAIDVNKNHTFADDVKASMELLKAQVSEMPPLFSAEERRKHLKRLEKNHQKRVARLRAKLETASVPALNENTHEEVLDSSHKVDQSGKSPIALAQSSWTSINKHPPALVDTSIPSDALPLESTGTDANALSDHGEENEQSVFSTSVRTPKSSHVEDLRTSGKSSQNNTTPRNPDPFSPPLPISDEIVESTQPSAKALGKRRAVDVPLKSQKKKKAKTIKDKGLPNGDLRTMFSEPISEFGSRLPTSDAGDSTRYADIAVELWDRSLMSREASAEPAAQAALPQTPATTPSVQTNEKLKSSRTSSKKNVSPKKYKKARPALFLPENEPTNEPAGLKAPDNLPTSAVGEDGEVIDEVSESPVAEPSKPKRRKRRLPVDDPPQISEDTKPHVKKSVRPKTLKSPSTPKRRGADTPKGKRDKTTKLNPGEDDAIIAAVLSFRDAEGLTDAEIVNIVQDDFRMGAQSSQTKGFWNSLKEQLPDITTHKTMFFCRRKFHNFEARGSWTEDQDEELREVYELHPKKWAEIGRIINRHSEDVRDRWRNYLVCGDSRKKDKWEESEEDKLKQVVAKCLQKIRENSSRRSLSEDEQEALLDWTTVSAMMDHTRSRLQCSNKWRLIRSHGYSISDVSRQRRLSYREKHSNMKSEPYVNELDEEELDQSNGEGPSTTSKEPNKKKTSQTTADDDQAANEVSKGLDSQPKRQKKKKSSLAADETSHTISSKDATSSPFSKKKKKSSTSIVDYPEVAATGEEPVTVSRKKKKFSLDSSQIPASTSRRKFKLSSSQVNGEGEEERESKPEKLISSKQQMAYHTPTKISNEATLVAEDDDEYVHNTSSRKRRKLRERMREADESTQESAAPDLSDEVEDVATSLQTLKHNSAKKPKAKAPLLTPRRLQKSTGSKEKLVESTSEESSHSTLSDRRQSIKDQRNKRAAEKRRLRLSRLNEEESVGTDNDAEVPAVNKVDTMVIDTKDNGIAGLTLNPFYDMDTDFYQNQHGSTDEVLEDGTPTSANTDLEEDEIYERVNRAESVDLDTDTSIPQPKSSAQKYRSPPPPARRSPGQDYDSDSSQSDSDSSDDSSDSDASSIPAIPKVRY